MNILIVEDEQLTREGIATIIQKHTPYHVVAAVEDGEKGLAVSRTTSVDVIITDIQMPSMAGLQMVKEIRRQNSAVAVIILTGYPDFNYAKESISLKVDEYLLKPLKIEELMASLKKIEQRDKKQGIHLKSPEELISLLLSSTDGKEKESIVASLNIALGVKEQSEFFGILIRQKEKAALAQQQTMEKIKASLETMLLEQVLVMPLPFHYGILVLSYKNGQKDYLKRIFERDILPEIQTITPSVAFCKTFQALLPLQSEIINMREMTGYALQFPAPTLIDADMIRQMNQPPVYPINLESKIIQAIYQKNGIAFRTLSQEFAQFMLEQKISPKNLIEMVTRFVTCCYNKVKESTPTIGEIESFLSFTGELEQPCFWEGFIQQMQLLASDIEIVGCENIIIERTRQYIQQHYQKDLSLPYLAERVGVTPEYLSKLFSTNVGVHFSVFLRNIRIASAKELLLSQNLQIQEISEQSGFSDPKYFNRVFKETCGMSPSEFRKRNKAQ